MSALADVAAAIADRTRARMLEELLAGPPLPAGALAVRVGVAPSTVSGHLARLEAAGLVTIESVGRRREARLAGPQVAEALEALRRLAGDDSRPVGLRAVNGRAALREARSCYDHLAGRAGVALADDLVARGALTDQFTVPDGAAGYYRDASASTSVRCRGAAHWSAPAPTGPSAARTSPARWVPRCSTRCSRVVGWCGGRMGARSTSAACSAVVHSRAAVRIGRRTVSCRPAGAAFRPLAFTRIFSTRALPRGTRALSRPGAA